MAGAASAHQAAAASREQSSQLRTGRTRRTSADPQRAQQGATAAAADAPAALQALSRLQHLADASPQVAQLRRLQALADGRFPQVAQLAVGLEEEELVQGKFATAQLPHQLQQAPRANNTGLPDQLKSGIESLSGLSMDHVRVHYNSSQPAQLNALAYAQGSDIHLAPGQERHLPHEAWHVVQQAQGRVRPTLQMKDVVPVNDDVGLEREADVMGSKALEGGHRAVEAHRSVSMPIETAQPIDGDVTNSPEVNVANNHSAALTNGPGLAQRGENEMQRIADQRPEVALKRQVQAWGDGSERVGQLRAWQGVADGRGVGGKRQDLAAGFAVMGARAAAGPAQRVAEALGAKPRPSANLRNEVAQAKIKPAKKFSQYLSAYGDANSKETKALEELFGKLVESAFIYKEDDIHEAIRRTGLKPTALDALFQSLQESQSSDIDEKLGGDRAHGVSRHYAISDKDLEARLRGPNAIPLASRFGADEGTRVLKLHNLICSALVKRLSTPAKQIGEKLHSVMHDPNDPYAALTTNANRKTYLQALANVFNDVIDEGDADSRFGFSITPGWKVQVAGAPAVVTIKCEFEVESRDDFDKDAWSLNPTGALVKGTATETAKMFSGSNSPVIVITTGDALSAVTAQTKGIIEKSGVTLF